MRCQRCGFELEPGQTFCSMCGTEQAKAMRKEKRKIKSIFWVIKVVSKNHLYMWINLFLSIALMFYIVNTCDTTVSRVSYICCDVLILLYTLVQCLIPYKNPNLSKSKSYKYAVRLSFGCSLVLFLLVLLTGDMGLLSLADKIRG